MKRAWSVGAILLVLPSLLACDTLFGRRSSGTQTFTVTLASDIASVRADLRETGQLGVEVKGSQGTLPSSGTIEFSLNAGVLLASDGSGTGTNRLSAPLDANGRARALIKCASMTGQPVPAPGGTPITVRVGAKLVPNGSDVLADVRAADLVITCEPVNDGSSISFVTPGENATVDDADRIQAQLAILDFDGAAPANTTVTISQPASSPQLLFSTTPTGPGQMPPLSITTNTGGVVLYVLYPGDTRTNAGPLPVTVNASFVNSLGATKTATRNFSYAAAPNQAKIEFVEVTSTNGSPSLAPKVTGQPFRADLAAGSQDAVTIKVQLQGRNGGLVADGTSVTFTCTSTTDNQLCAALEGVGAFQDAGVTGQNTARGFTVTEPQTPTTPTRSVATILFRAPNNSAVGTVRLAASFSPPNSASDVETSPLEGVELTMVDNSAVRVTVTGIPSTFRSTESGNIAVKVSRGTTGLAAREVCMTTDLSSRTRATLSDSMDDNGVDTLTMPTDGNGDATVRVVPISSAVRGPVTVDVVVVDLDYDQTRDTANDPCRDTGPNAQHFTVVVQIDRDPVLASLIFVKAEPAVLGVRGSSLTTTSRLIFRLLNDENAPVVGQQVDFALDQNRDPTASITPFGLTDASGEASAFLNAGVQAASLVARASATRAGVTVTAASDPVAVVGGKPAWSPLQAGAVGSYGVFVDQATTGYRDAFGATARPQPTKIAVQLVDRFSNRVNRAGYQVQLRAETGSIPNAVETDLDGRVEADYVPGPPWAMDTQRTVFGPRQAYAYDAPHIDTQHEVYRVGSPRDGEITILVATRGEESFVDRNGDGARQASEPFTDLPEPFLDRNRDALRANCDLPTNLLPVHHDLNLKLSGIGTYCNPYFDDPAEQPPSDVVAGVITNAAECRQHWCPDWDTQWNCWDNNSTLASGGQLRTPETTRIKSCPNWRYRDTEMVGGTVNAGAETSVRLPGGAVAPLAVRDIGQGYVLMPGVSSIVPGDATPITPANQTARLVWNNAPGTFGSLAYQAAGEGALGPAQQVDAVNPYLALQSGANVLHVATDAPLFTTIRTLAGGGVTSMEVQFRITRGDLRAPFDDFARSQLRLAQTDQFIDGNNDGVWNDINGQFDEDVLIWKLVTLTGSSLIKMGQGDWRYPGPRVEGAPASASVILGGLGYYSDVFPSGGIVGAATPSSIVLYDRLHSFVHVVPDSAENADRGVRYPGSMTDIVDAADHTGAGDFFVHQCGSATTFKARIVDANGVPLCPYDSGVLTVSVTGIGPNEEASGSSLPIDGQGCDETGVFTFSVTTAPTPVQKRYPGAGPAAQPSSILVKLNYTYDTKTGVTVSHTFEVDGQVYTQ